MAQQQKNFSRSATQSINVLKERNPELNAVIEVVLKVDRSKMSEGDKAIQETIELVLDSLGKEFIEKNKKIEKLEEELKATKDKLEMAKGMIKQCANLVDTL